MHRTPIFQIFSEVKRKDKNEMEKSYQIRIHKAETQNQKNISALTINVTVLNSLIKS